MYIHVPATTVSPNTATDGSTTTISTTNEPTTATNYFPMTENVSITSTPEGTEEISTIIDAQQSTVTANNAILDPTCSQNSATTGVIIGVAIGGILTEALLTLLATFIIVAIIRLTKKYKDTLTFLAVNQILQGISGKKVRMENVEEPVHNIIQSNHAVSDQLDTSSHE